MTVQNEQIQALIAEIDDVLGKASPRLPWVMSGEVSRLRRLLEKVRSFLVSLQAQDPTRKSISALAPARGTRTPLPASPAASARDSLQQQVMQSVLQDLHTSLVEPLHLEVQILQQQRQDLVYEIRQLEQQRQQSLLEQQQAAHQQLITEFLQSLRDRLQDTLTDQVAQTLSRLEGELASHNKMTDSTWVEVIGEPIALLNPKERLERLRLLQSQSDRLLLTLDSSIQLVFETLQKNLQSYEDSLSLGLDNLHRLGQQSELMFSSLINRLAEELGREASEYLQSKYGNPEPPPIPAGREPVLPRVDSPVLGTSEPSERSTPVPPETVGQALFGNQPAPAPVKPPAPREEELDLDLDEIDVDLDDDDLKTVIQLGQFPPKNQDDDDDDDDLKTIIQIGKYTPPVPAPPEPVEEEPEDPAVSSELYDLLFESDELETPVIIEEPLAQSFPSVAEVRESEPLMIPSNEPESDLFGDVFESAAPEVEAEPLEEASLETPQPPAEPLEQWLFAGVPDTARVEPSEPETEDRAVSDLEPVTETNPDFSFATFAELFGEETETEVAIADESPLEVLITTPPEATPTSTTAIADHEDIFIPAPPEETLLPTSEPDDEASVQIALDATTLEQFSQDLAQLERTPPTQPQRPRFPSPMNGETPGFEPSQPLTLEVPPTEVTPEFPTDLTLESFDEFFGEIPSIGEPQNQTQENQDLFDFEGLVPPSQPSSPETKGETETQNLTIGNAFFSFGDESTDFTDTDSEEAEKKKRPDAQ